MLGKTTCRAGDVNTSGEQNRIKVSALNSVQSLWLPEVNISNKKSPTVCKIKTHHKKYCKKGKEFKYQPREFPSAAEQMTQ